MGRRLVGGLLILFPARFRRQFGGDIKASFEDGWEEASRDGFMGALFFLLRTSIDLFTSGIKERVRPSRLSELPPSSPAALRGQLIHGFWQDIRFAVRGLIRRPGFTTVAVVTLGLGLGTATAVFSVINGVLLQPLPYPEAERLVMVWYENQERGWARSSMSFPDVVDIRTLGGVDFLEGFVPNTFTILTDGHSRLVEGSFVTGGLLEGFGLAPAMGRDIRLEENYPPGVPVVVIGNAFWKSQFGGDPDVLGTVLQIGEKGHEVVGVAPPGFDFPGGSQLWVPHGHPCYGARGCRNLSALGRIAPGMELPQGQSAVSALGLSLQEEHPNTNSGGNFRFEPLKEVLVGEVSTGLWILLSAVMLLLFVVCANLANLLLARAKARRGEAAIRVSLGASRNRLVRQVLVESFVLAGIGSGAGFLVSLGLVDGFIASAASSFPRVEDVGLDANVLTFGLALTLIVAFLFGLSPAIHLARQSVAGTLRGARQGDGGKGVGAARAWLLGAEVALSVILLVGAGLFLRTLDQLYEVDQGFEHMDVLRFNLAIPPGDFGEPEALVSLFKEVEEALRSVPGVASVGSVVAPPLGRRTSSGTVMVEGAQEPAPEDRTFASVHAATPQYFETIGLPVVRGRGLSTGDRDGTNPVAVVSEGFAQQNFQGRDVVGERFTVAVATGGGKTWTVVGVVPDTRSSLTGEMEAQVYVPLDQALTTQEGQQPDLTQALRNLTVHLRTESEVGSVFPLVRQRLGGVDSRISTFGVETVASAIRREAGPARHQLQLIGLFASLAILVALVGLNGVVSYLVSLRTREIGIRLTLGAPPGEIVRMVMRHGLIPVTGGILAGLCASLAMGRLLGSLLFGVDPSDPTVFGSVAVLVFVLSLAAIFLPARRASRLDPSMSLKTE